MLGYVQHGDTVTRLLFRKASYYVARESLAFYNVDGTLPLTEKSRVSLKQKKKRKKEETNGVAEGRRSRQPPLRRHLSGLCGDYVKARSGLRNGMHSCFTAHFGGCVPGRAIASFYGSVRILFRFGFHFIVCSRGGSEN
ncbi:hypothetical protein ISCGN_004104 [Ixodes scapularis]